MVLGGRAFVEWKPDFNVSWFRQPKDKKVVGIFKNGNVKVGTFAVDEFNGDWLFIYGMLRGMGVKQEFTSPLVAPGAWRGEGG